MFHPIERTVKQQQIIQLIIAPPQSINDIPIRRSVREKRPTIPNDYVVYLGENDYDIGHMIDPVSYDQAITYSQSNKWIEAIHDEMQSMANNEVWELVELPEGFKPIKCKWVFKIKRDSNGNSERYKARLVAKEFTQKEGIDYNDIFLPSLAKISSELLRALVAHFDLELHQMDVKTTFLNDDLNEEIYMTQLEDFVENGKAHMVCRLKKFIYDLKQAS